MAVGALVPPRGALLFSFSDLVMLNQWAGCIISSWRSSSRGLQLVQRQVIAGVSVALCVPADFILKLSPCSWRARLWWRSLPPSLLFFSDVFVSTCELMGQGERQTERQRTESERVWGGGGERDRNAEKRRKRLGWAQGPWEPGFRAPPLTASLLGLGGGWALSPWAPRPQPP